MSLSHYHARVSFSFSHFFPIAKRNSHFQKYSHFVSANTSYYTIIILFLIVLSSQFFNSKISLSPRNLLAQKRNFTSFLCIHSRGHKFAYRIFEILSGERKVLVKLAFLKQTPFQTDEDINRGSL